MATAPSRRLVPARAGRPRPAAARAATRGGRPQRPRPPTRQELEEERLLESLEELAQKLGIQVVHTHIRALGVQSQGGSCRVGERWRILIDRKLRTSDKVDLLATELGRWPLERVFVPPVLRRLLHASEPG